MEEILEIHGGNSSRWKGLAWFERIRVNQIRTMNEEFCKFMRVFSLLREDFISIEYFGRRDNGKGKSIDTLLCFYVN